MSSWGIESKLRSFVKFAIDKLDSATDELTDETPEDNFQELVQFSCGLSRHLKNVGAPASGELKQAISAVLAPAWDLKTDQPGPELSIDTLRAALEELLASTLADEEEAEDETEDVHPDGLEGMSLQDAITFMWEIDADNRVNWGDDGFTMNLQQKGSRGQDRCQDNLFDWVNKDNAFWSSPVTTAYINLLDNYERETGKSERANPGEKQEMAEFLDKLCDTQVMRFVAEYLKVNGGSDPRCAKVRSVMDLQNVVADLWFAPYRRYRPNDSSGFEHVFVGEEKRGAIIGLHNWVSYYLEEQKGNIDYRGWVGRQDSDYSDDVNLVTVYFAWEDDDNDTSSTEEKAMSTMLCGSTIEFEFAILTLAFLAGEQNGDNVFQLGSERIKVVCHAQHVRIGAPKIGTAYMAIA